MKIMEDKALPANGTTSRIFEELWTQWAHDEMPFGDSGLDAHALATPRGGERSPQHRTSLKTHVKLEVGAQDPATG